MTRPGYKQFFDDPHYVEERTIIGPVRCPVCRGEGEIDPDDDVVCRVACVRCDNGEIDADELSESEYAELVSDMEER